MSNSLLEKITSGRSYFCGEWLPAKNHQTFDVLDPSNGNVVSQVADCGIEETEMAIDSAKEAFLSWSCKEASFRTKILRRWNQLIVEHQEELSEIITLESGKPRREARGEALYGAGFVEWFAEEGLRVYGDTIPSASDSKRTVVIKQPIGVVAAITPWNFPVAMITRKVAPALAAGCTAVVKPAEETPLSALALAVLGEEAGIPKGVFNIVTTASPEKVGQILTSSPTVRKLSFTGSTAVGKRLMKDCSGTLKRLSFELGGNAPFIVFEDADLDAAAEGAIQSKFRNSGQTCVCANRLFVHKNVYQPFLEKLTERVKSLTIGCGEDDHDVGPLINQAALEKVSKLTDAAISDGAQPLVGGSVHSLGGNFFQPTVLANINADSAISKEEIFGPVAPVVAFESDEQVIQMANSTDAGLAAYFFGRDISRVWKVAEALEYGMVGINTGLISNISAPFGGIKESGFGREGSKYGIEEYLNLKYLCFQI